MPDHDGAGAAAGPVHARERLCGGRLCPPRPSHRHRQLRTKKRSAVMQLQHADAPHVVTTAKRGVSGSLSTSKRQSSGDLPSAGAAQRSPTIAMSQSRFAPGYNIRMHLLRICASHGALRGRLGTRGAIDSAQGGVIGAHSSSVYPGVCSISTTHTHMHTRAVRAKCSVFPLRCIALLARTALAYKTQ